MNLSNSRLSLNGALGASLLAIGVAALLVLFGLATLITAAVGGGTGGITPEKDVSKLVAAHKEQQKVYIDRINGRSAFYKPTPPVQPKPQEKVEPKPIVNPEPPKPTIDPTYRGPSPRFRVGDTVWFAPPSATEKPFAVSVGESDHGVKLLAVKSSWTIRVGYKGGEYDVDLGPKLPSSIESFLPPKAKPAPKLAALEEVRGVPLVPGTGAAIAAKEAASAADSASSKPAGENPAGLSSSSSVAVRAATGPTTNAAPGVEGEPPDQADPAEESQEPAVEHPKDPATVTNDPEPASDEPPPPPRRRVPPPPPTN